MPFFSDSGPGGFQPKRQFRFLVSFTELSNLTFMVTKAKKPSYTMSEKKHNVLNHVFNYPGVITWDPLDVSFIDAVDPNVGSKFYKALRNAGYVAPVNESALLTGVTKVSTTGVVGEVIIQQLDGGGVLLPPGQDPGEVIGGIEQTSIVDQWTLKNAFIKSVKWGDSLSYTEEGIVEVSVGLVYDYAEYAENLGGYGS